MRGGRSGEGDRGRVVEATRMTGWTNMKTGLAAVATSVALVLIVAAPANAGAK